MTAERRADAQAGRVERGRSIPSIAGSARAGLTPGWSLGHTPLAHPLLLCFFFPRFLWYFPAHCQIVKSHERQSAVQLMIPVPGEVERSFKRKKNRIWGGGGVGGARRGVALVLYTKAKLQLLLVLSFKEQIRSGEGCPERPSLCGEKLGPPPHLPLSHRAERVCSGMQPSFGGPAASALSIPCTGPGETLAKPPLRAQRSLSKAGSNLLPHKGRPLHLPSLPALASFPSCSPGKGLRVGGRGALGS